MSGEALFLLDRLQWAVEKADEWGLRSAVVPARDLAAVLAEVERLRTIVATLVESEVDP